VTSASTHVLFVPQNMAGMDPPAILNRTRVFLRAQRARRPDIPVLLLEGHDHGSAWINARARAQHNYTREAYRRAYNQLLTEGVTGLYYGQHALKFGGRRMTDFVAQVSTVAGVHPKPLGLRELATFASGLITAVLEGRASDTTLQPTGGPWPPPAAPPAAPTPGPCPPAPPGTCKQRPGGFIGQDVSHQESVDSWTACCDTCSANARCAKWVWVAKSNKCNLHGVAALWSAGPAAEPHVCGDVRNGSSHSRRGTSSENSAAAMVREDGESGEWLSDAALEEQRWRSEIMGWSSQPADKAGTPGATLVWTDARQLGVEGKGWGASASANFWQRLPDSAKDAVPAGIWHLSTQTSGILVRFSTNSSAVGISISRGAGLPPNTDDIFTTNGKQGFDIHIQGAPGAPRWRWAATEAGSSSQPNGSLVMTGLPPSQGPGDLNFTVYLPTYASVASLQIGVEKGSCLKPLHLYSSQEKPILVWGSSIAQGGVVTNSGMTWPSNLQRIMDRPLLNFGFSGPLPPLPPLHLVFFIVERW
jgi:hypothetical protein